MMNLLENVVINVILVLFPILVYFVYCCYNQINKGKNKEFIFEILVLTSLYLSLKYGNNIDTNGLLLFSNIPVLVSYLKKKDRFAILLSIFTIIYSYFSLNINIYFVIFNYITYFIIFYISKKKKIENDKFIIIITVIQSFYLSFFCFFTILEISLFIKVIWLIMIFLIISIFILYLFETLDKLSNIFLSITELKKDKQLKNSLFKLTHEIKNPLAVCMGYLEMLNLENIEKSQKYIDIIKEEIERSLLIMADFSELNKVKLNKDLVDINMLTKEVYDSLKLFSNNKNIELLFSNDEEIYLNIDYNKIKQVLINIIKNSIESITDKGRITINTYIKNNMCFLEVIDNGSGMDKTTLEKVSEMFFTTKKNGTGLGIALSNEIIKAHNGKIEYQSKIDVGTKVIIKLPL